ncbi:MAG: hypothetical protein H6732_14620 [Alphaproteobacteria bacterium]|nr:hypothetical protein [Alphaproteobacteria bacterium]
MRVLLPVLVLAACAVSDPAEGELVARAILVARAEGATGEVHVRESIDVETVLRAGIVPFEAGPLALGERVEVELPPGLLTLVAEGDLSPHPGCPHDDTGFGGPYEDGWAAGLRVWVGASASPRAGAVQVVPGDPPVVLRFDLQPECGCCLD